MMRHLALQFLLCVFPYVHGDDVMSKFITDMISSFNLISPTIIYHGNPPEICMTRQWVLCLDQENEQNEIRGLDNWGFCASNCPVIDGTTSVSPTPPPP